jgi:tetratricopeptide (TPR) repeat protein
VTSIDAREIHLRRLWDSRPYAVAASGTGLRTGDLVAAWLLPLPSGFRFGYQVMPLPVEITRPLEHMLRDELTILRRQRPDAHWDDLYRDCWPRLVDAAMLAAVYGDALCRVRVPGRPVVQGAPRNDPRYSAVAERIAAEMRKGDAHPEEVAGALRLWWDAVHALNPRVAKAEAWVGSILYLLANRVYGGGQTQAEIARLLGVSAATVGARAREIDGVLNVEPFDPRYADLLDPFVRTGWRLQCLTAPANEPPEPAPYLGRAIRKAERHRREDSATEDSPEARAEALIDEAWEAEGARRTQLAKRAIKLWPDAADAYVILGHDAMDREDVESARRFYEQGVQAGERALGQDFFAENAGHFWGMVETRPYMRARLGLAQALWLRGDREAALAHYQELLHLNPDDNQGVRYILASCYVDMGDDERLGQLLNEHADDPMADILFTRALWAFRRQGPSREADALLRKALEANPHVPAYLLGERPLPAESPAYIGWGDETEAAAYAHAFADGWRRTQGALQWLASRTGR